MESIFFIVFNCVFYYFFYYALRSFEFSSMLDSCIILLGISLLLTLPSIILLYILKKDRKKYFIFSSIYTIVMSFVFFKFGSDLLKFFNVKTGLANFTVYIYKYLFMFSPILSVFFVSLHKVFEQKKQLFLLIAFKYTLPIILGFIFMNFAEFSSFLWLLAITNFLTTVLSIFISAKKPRHVSKH